MFIHPLAVRRKLEQATTFRPRAGTAQATVSKRKIRSLFFDMIAYWLIWF
jgi:hypothetical protein